MAKETKTPTIQELQLANPDLKPSLIKFEAVKAEISDMSAKCLAIEVKDELTLSICEQNLSKINEIHNKIEEVRKQEKQPYWDKCVAIDNAAKYLTSETSAAIKHLKDQKLTYVTAVEKENKRKESIQESFDKLTAWYTEQTDAFCTLKSINNAISILDKQTEEKIKEKFQEREKEATNLISSYKKLLTLKKEELEALQNASPDEIDAIQANVAEESAKIQEKIEESKPVFVSSIASTPSKIRKTWKFELNDISKVPQEWLSIYEAKVKEWLKNNSGSLKDGEIKDGIKFYQEKSIVA